jgi:hypothetical protein
MTASIIAASGCESGSAMPEQTTSASGAPAATAELHGFAIGDAWNGKTAEEIAAQTERAKSVGSRILRLDIEWGRVRPDQNQWYDWTEIDRNLAAAKKSGQFVMATLAYAPEWARDDACRDDFTCAPKDPESYADFVNEFAYHISGTEYEETVAYLEIWNEQNNNKIDPEKYARMLALASQSIHMVLQDAKVGIGGMAPNAESEGGNLTAPDYLKAVNKALRDKERKQPADVYDAVGFHPYGYPAKPGQPFVWNGVTQTEGNAQTPDAPNLHALMVAEGIGGMEVWLNEFGAPTCGSASEATPQNQQWDNFVDGKSYVNRELQHQMITDFLNWQFQDTNVTIRLIHTLQDKDSKSTEREQCFGVFDDHGKLKTAGLKL